MVIKWLSPKAKTCEGDNSSYYSVNILQRGKNIIGIVISK